jgi:hypothetical protein
MTLQEWLERLERFDPDDWGDLDQLRAGFSEAELLTDVEAEITLHTLAGTIDQVNIQLIDEHENVLVNLDYELLQLDPEALAGFLADSIREAALPSSKPKEERKS